MTDYKELAQQALNEPDARKSLDLYNEALKAAQETDEWKVRLIELLPCPFCGGKATLESNGAHVWFVSCLNDCKINPETPALENPSGAIEAWNRRV